MTSFLIDALLLAALVATSVCVVLMHLRLRRLDRFHAEYERAFVQTAGALDAAREAVTALNVDGRVMVVALGNRIDEAKAVIAALEAQRSGAAPQAGPVADFPAERRA